MTRLIFLGPPGAGKGTQAHLLQETRKIPHISTGEILRSHVAHNTPLGEKARVYMDQGELVPNELILNMVSERLKQPDTDNGWILDGFPRNVSQAAFMDDLIQNMHWDYDWVVNLDVPDEVLIARLLHRGEVEHRSDDHDETTIGHRLQVYRDQTEPLIDYYRQRKQLYTLNGNQPMEQVAAQLNEFLNSHHLHKS